MDLTSYPNEDMLVMKIQHQIYWRRNGGTYLIVMRLDGQDKLNRAWRLRIEVSSRHDYNTNI